MKTQTHVLAKSPRGHRTRKTGPLQGGLIAIAALIGAALLLASDIAARTLLAPQELPVGIVTTALGAIFVLALVGRRS